MEEAIYCIEYSLSHDGAPYLRNAGADLSYLQLYNIDAYAILKGGLLLIVSILIVILRLMVKLVCKEQKTKETE